MIAIRRATPADAKDLHALIERGYRGDAARRGWTHEADLLDDERIDRAELNAILSDGEQAMLVAEEAGVLLGCVNVRRSEAPGVAYLGLLAVEPDRQAGGLGSALVDAAEAVAREQLAAQRIEMWVIAVRDALIAYYERRGYALTGERKPFPYEDGRSGPIEFVVLEKPLTPPVPNA